MYIRLSQLVFPPIGLRVRWGGVMSGFVVAIGTLMLLGTLGLAVGITAISDQRAATGTTAAGLGMGPASGPLSLCSCRSSSEAWSRPR
jgi:hypothetical protein